MSRNKDEFVYDVLQHQMALLLAGTYESGSTEGQAKAWLEATGTADSPVPQAVLDWLDSIEEELGGPVPVPGEKVPMGTNAMGYLERLDDVISQHAATDGPTAPPWNAGQIAAHAYFNNRAPKIIVDWAYSARPS